MILIQEIKERLERALPGPESQYVMAPIGRKEMLNEKVKYKKAAVLCLIYPKNKQPHMVFIQRTSHKKDKHSAQIAFPGGRVEKSDATIIDAALREAFEEVSVNPEKVSILKELTPLKIPVSGYEVFPVLAYTTEEISFVPQETEVEKVIEIPVADLIDPSNKLHQEVKLASGLILEDVPVFRFDEVVIWGATSMMLNEIIDILR